VKKSLLAGYGLAVLAIAAGLFFWNKYENSANSQAKPAAVGANQAGINKQQYSTTDPNSIWVIVNKKHPLPDGYKPTILVTPNIALNLPAQDEQMQVSSQMAPSLEKLFAGAQAAGINLKLNSAYRSEALQKELYDSYAARDGQAAAATYSAPPGTSEHQTGLAADIMADDDKCSLDICFADTPEGQWLKAHAHEYGFIIRYLKGKEALTTYQYEPWHIRYVGTELATQLYSSGETMEEFFDYN
jgi:D-alanyl-D-alanine carboxypeptidase